MSGKIVRNVKPIKDDRKNLPLSVIIPSAGEGVRMKSIGSRSLIQVSNVTLMEYQCTLIRDMYPHSHIVLVTGFDANRVMNKVPNNVICIENERYIDTNVCRSISIGLRACLTNHVLIIYGDLIFNKEILDFPIDRSCIVYNNSQNASDEEIGCTISDNKLENMFYGLPNLWPGIVYLRDKELRLFKNIAYDKQKEKLFGFEMINEVLTKGGEFNAYCPRGSKCMDIDSSKDIEKIGNIC